MSVVAGMGAAWLAADAQRPHIILLMTDQQRFDAMGCTSGGTVVSPHLDRLAAEGTLFENAYTSCPSSTPARAGLLTGLSPWHHGLLGYGKVAEHYRYEMPQMLREQGYFTFGIGKMHWFPQRTKHGFHGTLLDESGRTEDPNFTSDYRQWFQLHAPGGNPDATGVGWNAHGARDYQLDERLHPTRWTGDMACELIENYDTARAPLFLKVSFARPHSPYDPPRRLLDLYADKEIPAPWVGDWCARWQQPADPKADPEAAFGNFGDDYARRSRRYYYANVTFIDEEIGRIVQALKDKGMYDNALIVFVSDHGDMLGDHYHWRKTYPYEGSAHVPCIVKWPAAVRSHPARLEQPVELRDVLPTFLEAAGAAVPDSMDGRSLYALLGAEGREGWRPYVDLEHATCYAADNYWCALTDGHEKYVWNFHSGVEQFFDLDRDPHELHNAAADPDYGDRVDHWRAAMARHLSERGEPYVVDGRPVPLKKTILYGPNYPKRP